jgi:hypothetical protein
MRMASRLDSLFRPFEGARNPYPVALFRIAFFALLALHFFPALLHLDDGYAPGALRTEAWSHWLFLHFTSIPHGLVRALSIVTMLACVAGLVGLGTRVAAAVTFLGLYAFASFNALHVHTLALTGTWAILFLFAVCGGGSTVWSVDALLRKGERPAESKLLASLIVFQILLTVFFSGVEKLRSGWPGSNEMGILLDYPKGFLVRDWVWSSAWLHGETLTRALTFITVIVELGAPIALLFRRTRVYALIVFELFFLGIIALLEVPPLFSFTFVLAAPLVLSDDELPISR